jgi:hypothetical protein
VHFYGNPSSPPLVEKALGKDTMGQLNFALACNRKRHPGDFSSIKQKHPGSWTTEEKRKEKKQKGSQGKLADGENLDKNRRLAIPPRF